MIAWLVHGESGEKKRNNCNTPRLHSQCLKNVLNCATIQCVYECDITLSLFNIIASSTIPSRSLDGTHNKHNKFLNTRITVNFFAGYLQSNCGKLNNMDSFSDFYSLYCVLE